MTLAEEEDLQNRGFVIVLNFDGGEDNTIVLKKGRATLGSLPVRNDANHICLNGNNARLKILESTLKFSSGGYSRVRIRSHYGELMVGRS